MTIHEQIRQLASRPESKGPFLTLYLDTNRGDATQNERIRIMMKQKIDSVRDSIDLNGQSEAIEQGIREIERFLEEDLLPGTRGVAIFADPLEGFFEPIELNVPVEPDLHIGSQPHIRHLTELRELHPHVLVAIVDSKSSRLLEIEFGTVVERIEMDDPDPPRSTDQGGWSQGNIQRHSQDHRNHLHKDAAELLSKLFDKRHGVDVIVAGQDHNCANFRGHLPKRVDERVLGTRHLDLRTGEDNIVRSSEELARTARRDRLEQRLEELESASRKNDRGAVGFARVVDAVNQRKVEELLLASGANGRGWKCTSCGLIGESVPLGCPACGEKIRSIDLVEQFIAAAHQERADIGFVSSGTVLENYSGVGAFLRF